MNQQTRRGRRHLDGKSPGAGVYAVPVSFSLLPDDVEELTKIGNGNRSDGLRKVLETYRLTQQNDQ